MAPGPEKGPGLAMIASISRWQVDIPQQVRLSDRLNGIDKHFRSSYLSRHFFFERLNSKVTNTATLITLPCIIYQLRSQRPLCPLGPQPFLIRIPVPQHSPLVHLSNTDNS